MPAVRGRWRRPTSTGARYGVGIDVDVDETRITEEC